MDNEAGRLIDVAPLFDYNLALVADVFGKEATDTLSQMFNTNETIREITSKLLPYSNIQIEFEQLSYAKKYFKEYPQVYENIMRRIEDCYR